MTNLWLAAYAIIGITTSVLYLFKTNDCKYLTVGDLFMTFSIGWFVGVPCLIVALLAYSFNSCFTNKLWDKLQAIYEYKIIDKEVKDEA
jgi:hypothetical protein